ncbi:hypothetical protein SAMN04487983_1002300 [Streptomyces sp. yr375]|uniref:hypothetical protein n=1 Tax=Streptomyces sp. yr375 TaxID=1761906 RepID=UPI0008AE1B20|nr:hypothetical protein [Streptomyces sp. yr375]SEP97023.1 hypothetical protein SAMN04487983_1002300 [Streptomyces sp. yr375]
MTTDETPDEAPDETPDEGPTSEGRSEDESSRAEPEHDVSELFAALGGATGRLGAPIVYAPGGNINAGSVHGGQRVQNNQNNRNNPTDERRTRRAARVHEGPVPEAEVRAAAFGFAEPAWFPDALAELRRGLLFLAGRPGSGRRTAALNLLRERCGKDAPLRALDSVTELDRWQPADTSARGYLVDGLFPSRPLGPGVLGHVRSLLDEAEACMVIVLPDDTALLRRLEQDLHVRPVMCEPPPPSAVFGSRFAAEVPDQRERERLLTALKGPLLGELLVPELVPAEVVELVTAIVEADGDATALGDLRARLSYRAEREVPELIGKLRDDPDALAFLLAACVFERLDHRIVREEADRLLELSEGRLTAVLPATDSQGTRNERQPNPDFVFRRPLTELLHAVRASRQPRQIRTDGAYAHSVETVAFVRHRQAETVLRHVWREYGQLSELLVKWLREVNRDSELTQPVGRVMGMATSWGGGRRALRHVQALAESERTTSRLIAAHALGIAAEDPVLVAEVRYRLQRWSLAVSPHLRTTVAYACGAEFGLSRTDVALGLLHTLIRGVRTGDGHDEGEVRVGMAVRVAILSLFQAGNEEAVFGRLWEWLTADESDPEQLLVLFAQLLQSPAPQWFQRQLADETAQGRLIIDVIRRALNADGSFDMTCAALLRWADWGRWDETLARAVEHLFAALARSMRHGEFRLFVEMSERDTEGWAGHDLARNSIDRWRNGVQGEAA